jgi:hypothetical protein
MMSFSDTSVFLLSWKQFALQLETDGTSAMNNPTAEHYENEKIKNYNWNFENKNSNSCFAFFTKKKKKKIRICIQEIIKIVKHTDEYYPDVLRFITSNNLKWRRSKKWEFWNDFHQIQVLYEERGCP